jgi:D-alanyl-D-alanine carboxypeptidase
MCRAAHPSRPSAGLVFTILLAFADLAIGRPADTRPLAERPEVAAALQVLDAWIQTTVAEREQPGLSIGIVHDQDLIWSRGYGYADLDKKAPATPSTVYRIASISKLFTATAILQLRDAGKLHLDDPLSRHLSWFKIRNAHPEGPTHTIWHLLTHTSGLPRESPVSYWNDLNFPSREEMIRMLPEQETIFPAETEWKYSNLALALAGEIVAQASGEPYPLYIEKNVLRPLGMSATRVLPEPGMPALATGYGKRVPGKRREIEGFADCRGLTAAANLASNVEDLARFASLQFRDGPAGGAQILKGSTLREMQRIHWLRPDWKSGQGLGFAIRRVGEQVRFGHGGSVPGHRTQIEMAPEAKLAVIVLTNANDGEPMRYVNQALTVVGPAVEKATRKPDETPTADPAWEKYLGTYTWKSSDAEIMLLNGVLTLVLPDAENPWESRVTLTPVGPHTFRMKGGSSSGELLRFDVDASGRVTRLTAGTHYRLRKDKS